MVCYVRINGVYIYISHTEIKWGICFFNGPMGMLFGCVS